MEKVSLIETSTETIDQYAMCGYKNKKNEGLQRKVTWIKEHFQKGLKYKILFSETDGAIGGIEYLPGEHTWRDIEAPDYMVIQCIYIMSRKYKGKGYGALMLESCLRDAKEKKMSGVAVVTRKGTWMVSKDLFIKDGFEIADTAAPDFELLVKKLKKEAPLPKFKNNTKITTKKYSTGLTMIVSDQCPYVDKAIKEIGEAAQNELGIQINIVQLKNSKEAQTAPCPFGVFCLIHNGKILADHPISKTRFINIMNKELQKL